MLKKKSIPLYVPDIGASSTIKIVKWHKKEGETFEEDEELCDMISDKATFALEAPSKGKILSIIKQTNSIVHIKEQVATAEIYDIK